MLPGTRLRSVVSKFEYSPPWYQCVPWLTDSRLGRHSRWLPFNCSVSLLSHMSSPWYHYHTALELLAGANLALFAFPNLRQPAIEAEHRRWLSLLEAVSPGHCNYVEVLAGMAAFSQARRQIEQQTDSVRAFCLVVAVLCTGTLLWATARAEDRPDPLGPWLAITVSLAPGIVLVGLDGNARYRLQESSAVRRRLEKEAL
jgi:hypothetical protein